MILSDGRFADRPPAIEPPSDMTGFFTTIGCDKGKPLLLRRHLERLADSLPRVFSDARVRLPRREQLQELLELAGLAEGPARIRVVVWVDGGGTLRVESSAAAAGPVGPDRDPVKLEVMRWAAPPNPALKWLARSPWHDAGRTAMSHGCDDALLVDGEGRVLETSIANVFLRRGPAMVTPPAPKACLPGTMRDWVITNFEVAEREIHLEWLMSADEVWLTNAVAGIVRVGSIGNRVWQRWELFGGAKKLGVPAPGWPPSSHES